jgi:hypothetical protein
MSGGKGTTHGDLLTNRTRPTATEMRAADISDRSVNSRVSNSHIRAQIAKENPVKSVPRPQLCRVHLRHRIEKAEVADIGTDESAGNGAADTITISAESRSSRENSRVPTAHDKSAVSLRTLYSSP